MFSFSDLLSHLRIFCHMLKEKGVKSCLSTLIPSDASVLPAAAAATTETTDGRNAEKTGNGGKNAERTESGEKNAERTENGEKNAEKTENGGGAATVSGANDMRGLLWQLPVHKNSSE